MRRYHNIAGIQITDHLIPLRAAGQIGVASGVASACSMMSGSWLSRFGRRS